MAQSSRSLPASKKKNSTTNPSCRFPHRQHHRQHQHLSSKQQLPLIFYTQAHSPQPLPQSRLDGTCKPTHSTDDSLDHTTAPHLAGAKPGRHAQHVNGGRLEVVNRVSRGGGNGFSSHTMRQHDFYASIASSKDGHWRGHTPDTLEDVDRVCETGKARGILPFGCGSTWEEATRLVEHIHDYGWA